MGEGCEVAVSIAPGDPVTVVMLEWPSGNRAQVRLGAVDEVHQRGIRVRSIPGAWPFALEGVWWTRGHHTEDSEEGAALLAACALLNPQGAP